MGARNGTKYLGEPPQKQLVFDGYPEGYGEDWGGTNNPTRPGSADKVKFHVASFGSFRVAVWGQSILKYPQGVSRNFCVFSDIFWTFLGISWYFLGISGEFLDIFHYISGNARDISRHVPVISGHFLKNIQTFPDTFSDIFQTLPDIFQTLSGHFLKVFGWGFGFPIQGPGPEV